MISSRIVGCLVHESLQPWCLIWWCRRYQFCAFGGARFVGREPVVEVRAVELRPVKVRAVEVRAVAERVLKPREFVCVVRANLRSVGKQ
jgi:hypothetical protein